MQRLQAFERRLVQLIRPTDVGERNVYFLYIEVVFASMLSVAASFNGAFILRLGGSNTLVGLLSSLPALLAMLLYIPSAHILEHKTRRMPWIVWSLFLARVGYLFIALLPLVFNRYVPEITVAILVGMTIPSVLFSTSWSPLLSDVVPARLRATVLAWRSILSSGTVAPLIYLAGLWLNSGTFPRNYQWMYVLGFLAGAYSVFLVSRLRLPETGQPTPLPIQRQREPVFKAMRGLLRENPLFARIVTNTFLLDFGAWLVGPLYIILFVRQLGATDGWLGLNGTLANIGVIAGYWLWRRIIRRFGEAKTLLIALPLVVVYPFMVSVYPNLNFILFAGFFINLVSPGVGLSHSIIFLSLLPEGRKYTSTALYSTVMNIGAFIAPLIGVAVSDRIGIIPTLLIGGAMRSCGALLFYIFPIRPRQPQELPGENSAAA